MKRTLILFVVLFACLLWLDLSPASKRGVPGTRIPVVAEDVPLRDLVPDSALVAIELRGIEGRWGEIRSTRGLAGFQNSLFSCLGVGAELAPALAGDRAVLFLAPADGPPQVAPIAILRPADVGEAEQLLSGVDGLACLRDRGTLWVGPAELQRQLETYSRQEGTRLADIIPMDEDGSRLPPGGLIRGWVNPRACIELLRDSRIDACPAPLRWAAAAFRSELGAVRYAEFRRDLAGGELIADGLVAYEFSRLPSEVRELFDPEALPVVLPSEYPSNALAVVAFRPEARAWIPWLRYVSACDARGPLGNLGFWLDEFQARYGRNLDRDLAGAFGDRGWLLAVKTTRNDRSIGIAAVIETRDPKAVESVLLDLTSWMSERVWLESFGTILPRPWHETRGGRVAGGITLRAPFSRIPGPDFELADRCLVVAWGQEAMRAGLGWVEDLRRSEAGGERTSGGSPVHGAALVCGPELAKLVRASLGERAAESRTCVVDTIAALASDLEDFRVDMKYEQDAVRLHGRLRFSGHSKPGATWRAGAQKKSRRKETESLASLALSSLREALTWGMPAALIRQLSGQLLKGAARENCRNSP